MLRGLPASIIAHAAVVSASYLTWPYWGGSSAAYIPNVEAVDVNFAEIGEITDGTTLLQAVKERATRPHPIQQSSGPAQPSAVVTYSKDGSGAQGANVSVLVIGERPYAEMKGDDQELALDDGDLQLAREGLDSGLPCRTPDSSPPPPGPPDRSIAA